MTAVNRRESIILAFQFGNSRLHKQAFDVLYLFAPAQTTTKLIVRPRLAAHAFTQQPLSTSSK